jgi:hypothetical protein
MTLVGQRRSLLTGAQTAGAMTRSTGAFHGAQAGNIETSDPLLSIGGIWQGIFA